MDSVTMQFLDTLAELLGSPDQKRCNNTHQLTYQAAAKVLLPSELLTQLVAEHCCSCEILLNAENWLDEGSGPALDESSEPAPDIPFDDDIGIPF